MRPAYLRIDVASPEISASDEFGQRMTVARMRKYFESGRSWNMLDQHPDVC